MFNYAFVYYAFQDAGISQRIGTKLVSKTDTFVREVITDTREMKRLLKIIVKTETFKNENLPESTNKRFFPRTSTTRNHVTRAKRKLCHSLIDQECLQEEKINQWETIDESVKIFFRPKSSIEQDGDENSSDDINTGDDDDHDDIRLGKTKRTPLLFVYQNGWRRLFSR